MLSGLLIPLTVARRAAQLAPAVVSGRLTVGEGASPAGRNSGRENSGAAPLSSVKSDGVRPSAPCALWVPASSVIEYSLLLASHEAAHRVNPAIFP